MVLIEVVSPGVSHAEALIYLTEMHVDVGEFGREEVKDHNIQVVLLVEGAGVAENAHEVMNEVTSVEEAVVLHKNAVPDEVSEGVGEDDQLKVGRAL